MTMVAGSLTACGGKSEKKSGKKGRKRCKGCNYLFAAGQNDNGYNQSAVEEQKKLPMNLELNIRLSSLQQVYHRRWKSLADDGYNVIFNLEYDFEALIQGTGGAQPIAEMYPDTTFVWCK